MFRVRERNDELARAIVNSQSDMSFAGVLAGNNPGEVWVYNLENPSGAIVFFEGQTGFQFMGRFTEETLKANFENFVDKTAKEFLAGKADYFDFSCDDEKWLEVIKDVIKDREIEETTQFVYRADEGQYNKTGEVDFVVDARLVDNEFISFISDGGVSNPRFLLDYINTWWGTPENFLDKGYSYVTLKDGKIVSFSISSSCYGNTQAIGVETLKEYRRKGLAAYLASKVLKLFNENGIDPWWDCWEKNFPSQKTAEKIGLKLDYKYKVCTIKFK